MSGVEPPFTAAHRDHFDRPAKYTFFYPEEEYHPELLAPLAEMTRAGVADVEVHIHHDGEGEADFVRRIEEFVEEPLRTHVRVRNPVG